MEVEDAADSTFLVGEQVDREEFALANNALEAEGLRPTAAPLFCLASRRHHCKPTVLFQRPHSRNNTGLTEAAVSGKEDTLDGLKENVIVGR